MTLLTLSQSIPDFRIDRRQVHTSEVIVYITLAAVICDAQTWEDVALFGRCKFDYFKTVFPYLEKIPSHDTFNRFFSLLKPEVFERKFRQWVRSVIENYEGVIAIDGKTIKNGTYDEIDKSYRGSLSKRSSLRSKLHIVSACFAEYGISLGQLKVDEKTNEITAIPQLLKELDIAGCTITIDAMGCQKAIAKTIIEEGADYVLAVKENHKHLYKDMNLFFKKWCSEKPHRISQFETYEKGHGRIEERIYRVCNNLFWLNGWKDWEGLKTFVSVESIRTIPGAKGPLRSHETRYYISSLELDAQKIGKAIRSHWAVENNLHWQLDVTFNEDDDRKKNNAAQNFSVVSKVALAMLKKDNTKKNSIRSKRKGAGWDNEYLHQLLSLDIF